MDSSMGKAVARLFRAWWGDGLVDLLGGVAVAIAGIGWSRGLGTLALVQAPLWIVFWMLLRRAIVEPRAGFLRFSQARRERDDKRLGMALVLGAGLFALMLLGGLGLTRIARESGAGSLVDGLPAVIVAIMSAVTAVLTGARRFFVYSTVLLAGAATSVLAGWGPALPLTLGGSASALAGAVLLARFLVASRRFKEEARENG